MRKIPLGTSDFKRILSDPELFYIDKSGFIAEFLNESAEISLITRPRRFGKTLNLSMLRYFFEQENHSENRKLFENLQIGQNEEAMSQQGSRPVMALTFKDCKATNWEDMQSMLAGILSEASLSHAAHAKTDTQKTTLQTLIEKKTSYEEKCSALKTISSLYPEENKPLILIDEYDVPLQEAWLNGYWDEAIAFFKNFFSATFKDNPHIWRGVLTGCLRISKESMFTGMNNLDVFTVSSKTYSSKFGFTQDETTNSLEEFGLSGHTADVENWYNGYRFGETTIYNPWSISNFLKSGELKPYWVNTSGQHLEKTLLKNSNQQIKQELQFLMAGEAITVNLQEQAVFDDLTHHPENFWNFFYQTGYLKATAIEHTELASTVTLKIPNIELRRVYIDSIQHWFIQTQSQNSLIELGRTLQVGDAKAFCKIFRHLVLQSFSYFDVGGKNPESFYHAFTMGMMVQFQNIWSIQSNREAGFGRADLLLFPRHQNTYGVVMEFKTMDSYEDSDLNACAQDALKQIEKLQYAQELKNHGCENILEIGVGFAGKNTAILIHSPTPN